MKKLRRPCPLCGRYAYLTRCVVSVSVMEGGKTTEICESCIDILRERHMHVTIDDDDEEEMKR